MALLLLYYKRVTEKRKKKKKKKKGKKRVGHSHKRTLGVSDIYFPLLDVCCHAGMLDEEGVFIDGSRRFNMKDLSDFISF
jgi:hypothetical protein